MTTTTADATHPDPVVVRFAVLLAAAGVVLDQATKILAERLLAPGVEVPFLGAGIGWQLVYNPGAAFGLPAPPWVFLVVTTIVVVIVLRSLPATRSILQATAYALLLAGALGNLVDRLVRAEDGFLTGRVVDFVAWGSFPRFNVADSCITVGFVLLVAAMWAEERRAERASGASAGDDHGASVDDHNASADEPADPPATRTDARAGSDA